MPRDPEASAGARDGPIARGFSILIGRTSRSRPVAMAERREAGLRARLAAPSSALTQFILFGLVGGLGTVTNLTLFYVLVDRWGMVPHLGVLVCFGVAVSQNYLFNELWTFATRAGGRLAFRRYRNFIVASLLGLVVNAAVLTVLLALFEFPLVVVPQAIGTAAGMVFNFVASRQIVFRRAR